MSTRTAGGGSYGAVQVGMLLLIAMPLRSYGCATCGCTLSADPAMGAYLPLASELHD